MRVYEGIKPWHCAGIQIDPAIVRVHEGSLAIVQVYTNPALLESKQNCLPTCRIYITDENTDNYIYTTETRPVYAKS